MYPLDYRQFAFYRQVSDLTSDSETGEGGIFTDLVPFGLLKLTLEPLNLSLEPSKLALKPLNLAPKPLNLALRPLNYNFSTLYI